MNVRLIIVLIGLILPGTWGCEETPAPPTSVVKDPSTTPASTATVAPTTQELTAGARKDEKLSPLPLVATVPQSWQVKTELADMTFLKGHAPNGEVAIVLADRAQYSETALQEMLNAAKREAAANPKEWLKVDVREANGLKILETQRLPRVTPDPTVELPPGTPFEWTIRYFQKKEEQYALYELNFFVLTHEQYEKDREFLTKIIESVRPAT